MKETLRIAKDREVLSLVTDITYAHVPAWYGGTYRDLKMDLILPKHRENHDPCPVILWLCGGAFLVMDKSIWMPEMMKYAEAGYAIASAEYRTSNEVTFPAHLTDVKAAIRFLKAHAKEFCIDANQIFVMGESAGGALACLAGVTAKRKEYDVGEYLEQDSSVAGVVCYYGAFSENKEMQLSGTNPNVPNWTMQALLGSGFTREDYQRLIPVRYLDDGDIPPFLLLHGASDSLVNPKGTEQFYEELIRHGIPADCILVEGAEHGDDLMYQDAVKEKILAFMNQFCGKGDQA